MIYLKYSNIFYSRKNRMVWTKLIIFNNKFPIYEYIKQLYEYIKQFKSRPTSVKIKC